MELGELHEGKRHLCALVHCENAEVALVRIGPDEVLQIVKAGDKRVIPGRKAALLEVRVDDRKEGACAQRAC